MRAISINRTEYYQFLTVGQKNYSLIYYAEHAKKCNHDVINRFLKNEKYTTSLLWKHIKNDVVFSSNGYVVFNNIVLNKKNTGKIEIAKSQYSESTGNVTKGIGVVSLVYYSPDVDKHWEIDYHIFLLNHDGKTKIDCLLEMLNKAAYSKNPPFKTVFFDSWYATHKSMQHVDSLGKQYYVPIKFNRNITKISCCKAYNVVSKLQFLDREVEQRVEIHVKEFAKDKDVILFKLTVSADRVDYIATNDKTQNSSKGAQNESSFRWVVESVHRKIKQLTGIERCQCKKQGIQRNYVNCSFLVFPFLKQTANRISKTVYQIKLGLLDGYTQQ